ncbi:hypothetical protein ACP70R_033525 [Stipagrostis hirtigluma subsp. patula]
MRSSVMASSSSVVFLLLASFAAGASAANFTVLNSCSFTVWPVAYAGGGAARGVQLDPGQTWTFEVPGNLTSYGRVWARTGCNFEVSSNGDCKTGACHPSSSLMVCYYDGPLNDKSHKTVAEFRRNRFGDYTDFDCNVSVEGSYNLPMEFSCFDDDYRRSPSVLLRCTDPKCYGGGSSPREPCKTDGDYRVTFCPGPLVF